MASLKSKVGRNIKKLRRKKGITQEQLAERAGMSVDFISLVERGINAPSFGSLEKIAQVLQVSFEEIFNGKD